jgi:HK97 gp10 family phage protein
MKAVLTGDKELIANLRKFGAQADAALAQIVMATAQNVRTHAIRAIQGGPKTGKAYKKSSPNRTHRASASGQAPATDTGRLVSSIAADITGLTAEVSANVQYAAPLEFGTVNMGSRPFLQPALESEREKFNMRLMKLSDEASKGLAP